MNTTKKYSFRVFSLFPDFGNFPVYIPKKTYRVKHFSYLPQYGGTRPGVVNGCNSYILHTDAGVYAANDNKLFQKTDAINTNADNDCDFCLWTVPTLHPVPVTATSTMREFPY